VKIKTIQYVNSVTTKLLFPVFSSLGVGPMMHGNSDQICGRDEKFTFD